MSSYQTTVTLPYSAAGVVLPPASSPQSIVTLLYLSGGGGGGGDVASVFGRTGAVVAQSGDYTKAQVGLGNVDNTSDASKPVSTAQAAADTAVASAAATDATTKANAAQAYAIQRGNHTGTQTLSTISDAGTAASHPATDFATAAQGAKADTADQAGFTGADKTRLANTSGTNTGDQDLSTLASKLTRTAVKTGDYSAALWDLVPCDTSGGTFTVTLPAASGGKGRIVVKLVVAGNTLSLALTGSDKFNTSTGPTTGTLTLANQAIVLESDGTSIWTITADDLPKSALDTLYQPLDSDLTAIAALTTTSFGRSFLDRADAAACRTLLGLGTLATQSGTFSGTSSGTNTGDQDLSALAPKAALATKTSNYSMTTSDSVILANGTALTITLPSAVTAAATGKPYTVKNLNTSPVTLASAGGTIDGQATQTAAQYVALAAVSDGTNWSLI